MAVTYKVYTISTDRVIYIGRTIDIKRRQAEHNRMFKSEKNKAVYDYLRDINFDGRIELIQVAEFKSKTDAKRYEMLLILKDYFGIKELKQSVPQIKDF
jgi:predicted GIY-YIG superfamily endonuclease